MNRPAVLACRILLRHGDGHLPVDPLAMLRRCRNTAVMTERQAANGIGPAAQLSPERDALTWRQELEDGTVRWVVLYRAEGNPARVRFSLAHELGHIALGHHGVSAQEEREADCFASHLLCPRPALVGIPAEQWSVRCFVSPAAAHIAAEDMHPDISPELWKQVAELFAAN